MPQLNASPSFNGNCAEAVAFYARVLAPLGYTRMVERPATVGFGKKYPEFWLNLRRDMPPIPADTGMHVCLRAPSEEAVRAFHTSALEQGGASAVCTQNIYHFTESSILSAKKFLADRGVPVRM